MKTALLVSPYFPPSNLAGVQRVHLMSRGLKEAGWKPIVLTVEPECYEEGTDAGLVSLIRKDLHIERVSAWPVSICRRFGFGDLSLRTQLPFRNRIKQLATRVRPNLVFVTVLPGYSALVGAWAKQFLKVPFVLDYQDPWVSKAHDKNLRWNKREIALRIARWLEPRVLPRVDALTAVSDETFDSLRQRGLLPSGVPTEIIPIGADVKDHFVAHQAGRKQFDRKPNAFHIGYFGTLTERMIPALSAVLSATKLINAKLKMENGPTVHVHLVGTSGQPRGADMHHLDSLALKEDLSGQVHVHPGRIPYLDALRTMREADLLLLLGSTDSHYTASKLFPYWLSEKPIFGLFHEASTVAPLARELGGVSLILYNAACPPGSQIEAVANVLLRIVKRTHIFRPRNDAAFRPYSSDGVAQKYANLFNRVSGG